MAVEWMQHEGPNTNLLSAPKTILELVLVCRGPINPNPIFQSFLFRQPELIWIQ